MKNVRMSGLAAVATLWIMSLPASLADTGSPISLQQVPGEGDSFLSMAFRTQPVSNLSQFDMVSVQYGQANFRPWASSYWPIHKGLIANRFADRGFPESGNWSINYSYYMSNPPQALLNSGRISALSPTEKYDLLLEDGSWSLTRAVWGKVVSTAEAGGGHIPGWYGICHGWSAANHMRNPVPEKTVVVSSVHGRYRIPFTPADIKALISYLWAESAPQSVFIGNRCRGNATRDAEGRVSDPACFDNNPMTWHLSVLNRVGRDQDSMVMDSSVTGSVWNFAIDSYFFRYYNPLTLKPVRDWKDGVVSRENYFSDPFKTHRAPNAKYIIGVLMEVFHPNATSARSSNSTDISYKNKTFLYDLELDENYNVVGGEWHSHERPDFIWTFPFDSQAMTAADRATQDSWNPGTALPSSWGSLGQGAARQGKVMAKIVNGLLARSVSGAVADPETTPVSSPVSEPAPEPTPEATPTPEASPTPTL